MKTLVQQMTTLAEIYAPSSAIHSVVGSHIPVDRLGNAPWKYDGETPYWNGAESPEKYIKHYPWASRGGMVGLIEHRRIDVAETRAVGSDGELIWVPFCDAKRVLSAATSGTNHGVRKWRAWGGLFDDASRCGLVPTEEYGVERADVKWDAIYVIADLVGATKNDGKWGPRYRYFCRLTMDDVGKRLVFAVNWNDVALRLVHHDTLKLLVGYVKHHDQGKSENAQLTSPLAPRLCGARSTP